MAEARAGVIVASELNVTPSNVGTGKVFDSRSPAAWSLAWFVLAIIVLFVV